MRKRSGITAIAVMAVAALLPASGPAEAQRVPPPYNPPSITIGRDDGMRCVRGELRRFAATRNTVRRIVQIECPGVLGTLPPVPEDHERTVAISLHLIPSEARCLLRILEANPSRPVRVALRQCNIPLERGR